MIYGIFILLICIFFTGCTESLSNEEQRFIGTWQMEEMNTNITFYSNGDVSDFFGDTFEVKDGKFVILTRFAGGNKQQLYDYSFSDNDTKLVLTNINTQIVHHLIKQ